MDFDQTESEARQALSYILYFYPDQTFGLAGVHEP
jgi:hypothetical protein